MPKDDLVTVTTRFEFPGVCNRARGGTCLRKCQLAHNRVNDLSVWELIDDDQVDNSAGKWCLVGTVSYPEWLCEMH